LPINHHKKLHQWYQLHGRRELPWRNVQDPYPIYLSEVMLQQTQVKTVRERYYFPFLAAFPTLKSLAQAPLQEVLKQWEGLGYYSRAANLHKAAVQCGGVLPDTITALMKLPGIGKNTAHAIACFAFKQPVPIMEANVKRILCRVFALENPDPALLWEKAERLLDKENPFDYNQAMMDIGALVCKKNSPHCDICPLNGICEGQQDPLSYPAPKASKRVRIRKKHIVVWQDKNGNYILHKRTSRFLGGLYGFPEYEEKVEEVSFENLHYPLGEHSLIGEVSQTYSHFTLEAKIHHIRLDRVLPEAMTLKEMLAAPLSGVDHKIIHLLQNQKLLPALSPKFFN